MVVLGGGGEMGLLMNKERNALKGAKNGAKGSSAVLCVCSSRPTSHVGGCSETISAPRKWQVAPNPSHRFVFPDTTTQEKGISL